MKHALLLLLALWLPLSLAAADGRTRVVLHTSKGDIRVALYDETPRHRDNFIHLCQTHFYDSLLFHRVIRDFMVQAGDPSSRGAALDEPLGEGDPGYTLPAEIRLPSLHHKRGALAAAREGDDVNPERRSSGSQFYIVWGRTFSKGELRQTAQRVKERTKGQLELPADLLAYYRSHPGTPHLDGQYTVFGEVEQGLDVVDAIQRTRTIEGDRPFDDVLILSTEVLPPEEE